MENRVITQEVIFESMREINVDLTPFKKLKTFNCKQYGDQLWVLESEVLKLINTEQEHGAYNYLSAYGYIYSLTILN